MSSFILQAGLLVGCQLRILLIQESAPFSGGFNDDAFVRRRPFPAVELEVFIRRYLHVGDLTAAHGLQHLAEQLLPPRGVLGHQNSPSGVLLPIPGAALGLPLVSILVQQWGPVGVFVVVDRGQTRAHVGLRMIVGV